MSLTLAAFGAAALSGPVDPIVFRKAAAVSGPAIRLGDVSELAALPAPLRHRAKALVLARWPQGRAAVTIDQRDLANRARLMMPVLGYWLPSDVRGSIELRSVRPLAPSRLPAEQAGCFQVQAPVEAGAIVDIASFRRVTCGDAHPRKAFRYDQAQRSVRASRMLGVGETVTALPDQLLANVIPGMPIYLTARVGPVTIERRLEALQSARPGQNLFARTVNGEIVSVPFTGELMR